MLYIRVLGEQLMTLAGEPVALLQGAKSRALFFYLVLSGRPKSRAALAAMFWGDTSDQRALMSLRQALHQIRQVLPGYVVANRTEVMLDPSRPIAVDAHQFAQFAQAGLAGDQQALEAASEYYGGELLRDLWVPGAPSFEEWLLREREWLSSLAFRCLRALADGAVQDRQIDAGLRYTRRLLEIEPWFEHAHQQLIQLLAWDGQIVAALAQYDRCCRLLADELGVTPSSETTRIAEQIRTGLHAATSQPAVLQAPQLQTARHPLAERHRLLAKQTTFVGRTRELSDLNRLLSPDSAESAGVRLLTLIGSGGVGKTRLALQVAVTLFDAFPNGGVLVDLSAVADPDQTPAAVASALGLDVSPYPALPDQLIRHLRSQHMLLLLDNCEHVIDAVAQLADRLLRACPHVHMLATSREALQIAGELRYPLHPLPFPPLGPLAAPADYPATQLFLDRLDERRPGFVPRADELLAIADICRRLDGLPLAIELAAAQAVTLPIDQIAAHLDTRLHFTSAQSALTSQRHQTLHAMIHWSVELLSDAEQALLRRLAVFTGGWTLSAGEVVCTNQAFDQGRTFVATEVLGLLINLIDKSLVVLEDERPIARYRMLETTRLYAADLLAASGEAEQAHRLHLEYLVGLAESAQEHLLGPDQKRWLERLNAEHDNFHTALAWAAHVDPARSLDLAAALGRFWFVCGHFNQGYEALRHALAVAPPDATAARALALLWSGRLAFCVGEAGHAAELLQASLAISRALGETALAAAALNRLAIVIEADGDYAQVRRLLGESLALYRSIADQAGCAAVLHDLAQIARVGGDYATGRRYAEECLSLHQSLGHQHGLALAHNAMAELVMVSGAYTAAQQHLDAALTIQTALADRQGMAYSFADFGQLALLRCDYRLARHWLAQSLSLHRELDNRAGVAGVLCDLGAAALYESQPAAAVELLDQSLKLHIALGNRADLAYTRYVRAMAALAQGDEAHARDLFTLSLQAQQQIGNRRCIAACLIGCAYLCMQQADPVAAVRLVAAAQMCSVGEGFALPDLEPYTAEHILGSVRAQIDPARFADAWASGCRLSPAQAITAALCPPAPLQQAEPVVSAPPPLLQVPLQLSDTVERITETIALRRLLMSHRLVTLNGPSGIGKTTLAIAAALQVQYQFAHGVCFVDLSALNDPALLPQAVAAAFDLREQGRRSVVDLLCSFLHDKNLLLILDNCEHMPAACVALLQHLLNNAPHLQVLATSREMLQFDGAANYSVPALELPSSHGRLTTNDLMAYPAIRLFCMRAAAIRPSFVLTADNTAAVVQICRQLEGLPLAIELAAARISAMTTEEMAARLHTRLHVLLAGSRSARTHHRTLRSTIDWSYLLLNDAERSLLRILAVFAGGSTAAAISAVATAITGPAEQAAFVGVPPAVPDLLRALTSKSLLYQREERSETRYYLLETIREYAHERLIAAGEEMIVRDAHLRFFVAEAEAIVAGHANGEQAGLVAVLSADNDNIRAALEWCRRVGQTAVSAEQAATTQELGLRLAGAIWHYWVLQGALDEGYAQLSSLLALDPTRRTAVRAGALYGLAAIVARQDLYSRSPIPLLEESVSLWCEVGDQRGLARALIFLGATLEQHDPQVARLRIEAGLELLRVLEDTPGIAEALHYLGRNALRRADLDQAQACYEESRACWQHLGNNWGLADSLNALGTIAMVRHDPRQAIALYRESLSCGARLKIPLNTATVLCNLGNAEVALGYLESAESHVHAALTSFVAIDNYSGIAQCLALLAVIAGTQGDLLRAAVLNGASQALREVYTVAFGLAVLVPAAFHFDGVDPAIIGAQSHGRMMPLKQVIAYALNHDPVVGIPEFSSHMALPTP